MSNGGVRSSTVRTKPGRLIERSPIVGLPSARAPQVERDFQCSQPPCIMRVVERLAPPAERICDANEVVERRGCREIRCDLEGVSRTCVGASDIELSEPGGRQVDAFCRYAGED